MGQEAVVQVFNKDVAIRLGLPRPTGHLTAAVVIADQAWPEVFEFDPVARLFHRDLAKLDQIIKKCRPASSMVLTVTIFFSDCILRFFKAVLGLFFAPREAHDGMKVYSSNEDYAFGKIFGLLFGLAFFLFTLAMMAYVAPLFILSFLLRAWRKRNARPEIEKLTDAAQELFDAQAG